MAAETISIQGAGLSFRWAHLTPAILNDRLTAVADWVHLGEIAVIPRIATRDPCDDASRYAIWVACRSREAPI
jgi:hypothetical protein